MGGAVAKDQIAESQTVEGANTQISAVQDQVNIYSKELQSMNRSIHWTRKGFQSLESKLSKSTEALQIVLKQVKIIKNDVDVIKNNATEETTKGGDDANDEDDSKVSNA